MFEKMTPRERILAKAVFALLPATLIFIGVFWFIGKYGANNLEVMNLMGQVEAEQEKLDEAFKANRRRIYFNSVSLPSKLEDASNDYQIWLKMLLDEIDLDLKTLTPRDTSPLKFQKKEVGERKTFAVTASGDLQQLTDFLVRFYSVDLLHRINSLKIIPLNEVAGNDKRIRTGKLSINFTIEVLALSTAEEDRDFTKQFRELTRTKEQYEQVILRRNIFGPANNTPVVTARPSPSYTSETDAKINVTGKDADERDQLKFELVDSAVEGAKLEFEPGDRNASLIVPGQKEGKYDFKVKVTDNGFPPKENFAEMTVTFKDRAVVVTPPPPPPKPAFVNAKETRITAIVKDSAGDWLVWVKVRTTGDHYKLKVGDSFELDKKKWSVESIASHEAVLRVDNKLLTFHPKDAFVNPRNEVNLSPAEDAGTSGTEAETTTSKKVESDEPPKPRSISS
jgi:hypothetical protein